MQGPLSHDSKLHTIWSPVQVTFCVISKLLHFFLLDLCQLFQNSTKGPTAKTQGRYEKRDNAVILNVHFTETTKNIEVVLKTHVSISQFEVWGNWTISFESWWICKSASKKRRLHTRHFTHWVDCCWAYAELAISFLTGDAQTSFWDYELAYFRWPLLWLFLNSLRHGKHQKRSNAVIKKVISQTNAKI